MNIVLIGYRGTGKSSVATALAQLTGWPALSTDAEIMKRIGGAIPAFVEAQGWEAFRDIEAQVVQDVAAGDQCILDTGGGVVLRPENVEALRRNGRVFWLTAPVGVLHERLAAATDRPSLTGNKSFLNEIEDVLEARRPLYSAAADAEIDTTGKTPEDIATGIVSKLDFA